MNKKHILSRTAQLAELADGRVMDNPRVGAVLVHNGRIIGEGYHQIAGQAHAEVNCIDSVSEADRALIPKATLYVSLEPCCVKGRTPACTGLILKSGIRKVVFGQRDYSPAVSGRGATILREGKLSVKEYPDFAPTAVPNAHRRALTALERPYILLKYARSADGLLRPERRDEPYWISGELSRRLVHRWRSTTNAIVVGARTVIDDDPSLTTRLWPGPSPRPVIIDPRNRLTGKEKLFRDESREPIVYCGKNRKDLKHAEVVVMRKAKLSRKQLGRIFEDLKKRRLGHVTVEGGAALLDALYRADLWDEARLFTSPTRLGTGLTAPDVPLEAHLACREYVGNDLLETFFPSENYLLHFERK